MIITLTKADFSLCKIGTLTTFNVRKSTVIGASVNIIKTSVERAGYSSATTIATIVLDEANYEGHAIKVMMGSTDVSSWYSVGKVIVPAKTPITSNITISVSATAVSGGDPIIPDVPVTPTMYTFTINPMVANATVTLTASGYKQSGNSISVPSGTTVSWTVSAGGYFDKNGSETVTKDKTLNVDLGKIPDPEQPGTGDIVNLSTISYEKTSDVTYNNGAITSTATGSIINDSVGTKQTIILKEPLVAGQEIEIEATNNAKKFHVIGLNDNNTLESLKTTACYNGKIMATPINLYFDPSNSDTIMSFESSDSSLNKPVCSGDGSKIEKVNKQTYTIIFKRDDNGNITVWQKDKGQIIPPADAPTASNPHTITTQWNNLNSKNNTYLCIHGIVNPSVSYKIKYFGKLRQ